MSKPRLVYLYEAARYQDKNIVDFYVKQFLADHPEPENIEKPEPHTLSDEALTRSLHSAITYSVEKDFLQEDENAKEESQPSKQEQLDAIFSKRYESVGNYFDASVKKLHEQWPETLNLLAENLVNALPNPLETLNESVRSKIKALQDTELNTQLARLERQWRDNVKKQLSERNSITETFMKIPQLKNSYENEVNKHIKQNRTWQEANALAMKTIIEPIQHLNISIIVAGNFHSYFVELKNLLKEVIHQEIMISLPTPEQLSKEAAEDARTAIEAAAGQTAALALEEATLANAQTLIAEQAQRDPYQQPLENFINHAKKTFDIETTKDQVNQKHLSALP